MVAWFSGSFGLGCHNGDVIYLTRRAVNNLTTAKWECR